MRTKHYKENERYLGIFNPQLPGKCVKGWCISWIEGKIISAFTCAREKNMRYKHGSYNELAAVTSCAR